MKIAELRSQFTVFVALDEVNLTTDLKQMFATSGYETFMFIDQDLLIDRVRQAAPHVILFSPQLLSSSLSEFTQSVLRANSEVQFVCVAPAQDAQAISEYRDFGFAQFVEPGQHLAVRALWAVDSVCERLALTYQNEALLEKVEKAQIEVNDQAQKVERLSALAEVRSAPDIGLLLERFQRPTSKEDLVINFLKWFSERIPSPAVRCVYFKFLPTVVSFVATHGHNVDLERTKGVGSKLGHDELKNLMPQLSSRQAPASLRTLMNEAFQVEQFFCYPLILKNQVEGLFVCWGVDEKKLPESFAAEFSLFQVSYQNTCYQRRMESLEVTDPATDLYNRQFFFKKLDEEIARSRRLTKPVSVIKISVDHYQDLAQTLGAGNRELILRSIASLVKKTSRVNDFACRTGEEEISLILPHCARKGAAMRAERLRKAIESHSFAINGIHVTVSSGVSEYPSLSKSSEDLDFSSTQAREFIAQRGGNKVCLFKPSDDFKPDFDVPMG